jgi:DNA-binding winged helix-turn-helix (wHTH) protein
MGHLRRKVDEANEAQMISNVRRRGFVLSAKPVSQNLPTDRLIDRSRKDRIGIRSLKRESL